MSSPHEVSITERDTTLNPRQLRQAGFVPGTLYGKGRASQNVQLKAHELELVLAKKATSVKLSGTGFNLDATIQQVQVDPVSRQVLNIELRDTTTGTARTSGKAAKASQKEPVAV